MNSKVILHVEYRYQSLWLVRKTLELADYTVMETSNTRRGLLLTRTYTPALILLALDIADEGGFDGIQLAMHLKRERSLADIPLIGMVSASHRDRRRAEVKCDKYLSKVILPSELLAHIAELMAMRQRVA